MTPNRAVALLTPLVFAPLAGTISALLAEHFPGVDLPASSITDVFIAGALIAFGKAAQWTHGWQKYEAREARSEEAARLLDAAPAAAGPAPPRDDELLAYDDELLGYDPELDADLGLGAELEPDAAPSGLR